MASGQCEVLLPGVCGKFEYSIGIPAGNQGEILILRTLGPGPDLLDLA